MLAVEVRLLQGNLLGIVGTHDGYSDDILWEYDGDIIGIFSR